MMTDSGTLPFGGVPFFVSGGIKERRRSVWRSEAASTPMTTALKGRQTSTYGRKQTLIWAVLERFE